MMISTSIASTFVDHFLSTMDGSEIRLEGDVGASSSRQQRRKPRRKPNENGGEKGEDAESANSSEPGRGQRRGQNNKIVKVNNSSPIAELNKTSAQQSSSDKSPSTNNSSLQSNRQNRRPRNQSGQNSSTAAPSGPQQTRSGNPNPSHPRQNRRNNNQRQSKRPSKRDQELQQVLEAYGIPDSSLPNGGATSASSASSSTTTATSATTHPSYSLALAPSDPDFPFDINFLIFKLYVPQDYPTSRPWISIQNVDIPKGYSANIESGFRQIATKPTRNPNMMKMLEELNSNLETFLKMEKQDTIKIVKHKQSVKATNVSVSASQSRDTISDSTSISSSFNPKTTSFVPIPKAISEKRKRQMDMLIKRLGESVAKYNPQASSTQINVTITPPHSEILPEHLSSQFTVTLNVPIDYGISPCTVILSSHDDASLNVMTNFNAHSKAVMKSWSLLALVNYLGVELENLMLPNWVSEKQIKEKEQEEREAKEVERSKGVVEQSDVETKKVSDATVDINSDSDSNSDTDSDSDSDSDADAESKSNPNSNSHESSETFSQIKKQGTGIDLVDIKMTNIGFLECHSLSLILSCNKCKTENEVHNIESGPYGRDSKAVALHCEKCNSLMAAAFRKNFLHSHSSNAGYLDLSGCSASDILPSSFTPTCGQCTTSWPQAFRKVEFGRTNNFNCRECHAKISLLISEFRFDIISTDNLTKDKINANLAKRRDNSQKLGLIGGTPLPKNGSCQHYKKSNRWFRFSCCSKVFPCDRCHDEVANHTNERAHRMICGKCSREQNFSDTCLFCHHSFDTRFSPFWEGGKGTRDKARMSRKDPHKYKRVKN